MEAVMEKSQNKKKKKDKTRSKPQDSANLCESQSDAESSQSLLYSEKFVVIENSAEAAAAFPVVNEDKELVAVDNQLMSDSLIKDKTNSKQDIANLCESKSDAERSQSFLDTEKCMVNENSTAAATAPQTVNEDEKLVAVDNQLMSGSLTKKKAVSEENEESCKKFCDDFTEILNINKEIVNKLKMEAFKTASKTALPTVLSRNENENETYMTTQIKPYTESQLSALYHNDELEMLEAFNLQYVEAELKGLAIKQHPLYELLMNYLHVREKITGNTLELEQIRKEYKILQDDVWTIETATVSGRGECQDGNSVSASHNYNKSIFHRSVFQSIVRILGNVQKLTYENHVLYSFSAEELRMQIDLFLQTVINNCINVTQLDKNAPVALTMQAEPHHIKPYLAEVRLCVSILFSFQRKLVREAQFIKETRTWLTQLVAVLLRLANFQDHLFLLNHILRCPAGIGSWASGFVQTPLDINLKISPFASYQINHILAVLATLLMPIKARERFLEDLAQNKDLATDALWVMVDSDGEEDEESTGTSLRENDLVALLNQLPLDNLFRDVLLINRRDYQDVYDISSITEHHILRFLAFSTVLLKIIHTGIQTYDQPRYNQFSKRLSRFIRHVAQYATDQWEQFTKVQNLEDKAMLERLQVEYDAFFLRTIYYLYTSQKLGAWQFLAVVPYHMVTLKTLWKVFYFLHSSDRQAKDILNPLDSEDYSKKLWEPELRSQFEEKLADLEDAEVYYLLNTFANMALAREETDMDFIYAATIDLLKVGFISESTQDTCSKSARILLTHLTSKHPHLLSDILIVVKENIERIGALALYLYEELPLSIWKIADTDLQLIARLLLSNAITTNSSKLARMILSRLNWDSISYEVHCDVAILVVNAADQEPGLLHWAWQTILRLKLHINDKAFKEIGRIQEVERYDILVKGIREMKPLASFVTILMTTWGHLVPLICSKGLAQLLFLQSHQKHEAVLFALYQIIPLFIESQECIINCDKFQDIISNLLNADRGYISMAKSLVYTQDTVLQQFGNMIETQIVNFAYYDLESPRCLVRLWINSLVSVPNWNKDTGIIYLLDVIVRTSFFHKDALDVVYNILKELLQCDTPQEQSGTIGSILRWVSSTNVNGSLISNSLFGYTWLAYVFIAVEHQEKEVHTGLWNELLVQLSKQKGKVSVDQALKKACSAAKLPVITSGSLCIYRWAQQALDTPIDHPLLPLLWQNFFTLYLARIPPSTIVDKSCVGEKFFDGLVNFAFLKKIKRRLQESMEYFQARMDVVEEDDELSKKQFCNTCHKIFRAFSLWLEEPRLQENNVLLKNLPPQYEPVLLAHIMQGSKTPWLEYLDYDKLKTEQQNCIRTWRVANFREKTNVNRPLLNPGGRLESSDPKERILRRLTSYDEPKAPPAIVTYAPIVPKIDFSCKEDMFKSLEECFKMLKQFAHNHTLKLSEHKALDCSYQELIPQLYRSVLNKTKKKVPCKGRNQAVHCSGAAVIVLEMQEARINERIDHQIQSNRNAYESLLVKSWPPPSINLITAAVALHQTIKMLQSQLKCNPATAELGVELFYYILSRLNEETNLYPPTKILFSACLESLGQSHICGVEYEMPRLLQKILNEPNLATHLSPHFSTSNMGTANLLLMYSTICKETSQKFDTTFALLSKFEIDNWLQNKQPKLSQRSQFIQSVIKALTILGFDPPVDALMLHGLYRKHLLSVFEFQFPEHYGEVLMHLLKASNGNPETNLLAISVWLDILNSLSQPTTLNLKLPLRDQLRQYAQHQKMLQHQELLETSELLSRHFTQERLQYGLYGLYPKCRNYMDVFVILLGMTGHGIIVSMLNTHQGLLGDKLCEKIWPFIRDMFAPWIVPYSMQNLKENMASWIQQLADDRSILLPWISADGGFAQKVINVFFECVTFIIHTLPASSSILSYIWQWYVTCYAHTSVKDHILLPIHHTFLCFPWHNFWPSIIDLEFMLRVVDQYLPECHSFLGHVFMSVPWPNWLNNFANTPPQVKGRVYQCFLNLVVKLCNEPNVKKNYSEKAKSLLVQVENFDWSILEPPIFQHVMDWVVMSFDSAVIFKEDPLDLDYRVLHFLKTVSGYNRPVASPSSDILHKRLIYVKTYIKLLSVYSSRNKNSLAHKEQDIYFLISRQLNDLESMVTSEEEMTVLLKELLCMLNIDKISGLSVKAFHKWIENKPGNGLIVKCLLRTLGTAVNELDILAELLELTLTSYFCNIVSEEFQPTWREVGEILNIIVSKQTELEQAILNNGCLLTLNAILVQRISKSMDTETLLNLCLDWIINVKINEATEPKMPLLWCSFIMLVLQHSEKDEAFCGASLHRFAQILLHISDDKGNTSWGRGFLTAIGLTKQGSLSLGFRFLCRALAGYTLAQLPEMKGEPRVVRRVANAAAKVGQPGGNTECVKVLLTLDFGQSQGKIKECAELALKQIQDPNNSLHNARKFILLLVRYFYIRPYLKDIG